MSVFSFFQSPQKGQKLVSRRSKIQKKRLKRAHRPRLSKHDPHNLELKFSLDLGNEEVAQVTDIYLFLPTTIPVASIDKSKLYSDISTRVRMALPRFFDEREMQIDDALLEFKVQLSAPGLKKKDFEKILKPIGGLFGDLLKAKAITHQKTLKRLSTFVSVAGRIERDTEKISKGIKRVSSLVMQLQKIIEKPQLEGVPMVQYLDEYLHFCYVEYLNTLHSVLVQSEPLQPILDEIQLLLKAEAQRVYSKRETFAEESMLDLESQVIRRSQLKKFFQSDFFIQLERKQHLEKLAEPIAILGAACAGLTGALIQSHSRPGQIASLGFKGLMILCFGVFLYVVRDRLKDRFKAMFKEKIKKKFADHEFLLKEGEKKIGRAREWFSLKNRSELPPLVQKLRSKAFKLSTEKFIDEDVIIFSNRLKVFNKRIEGRQKDMAIQRILRINFARYLKYLDDSQKNIIQLAEDGTLNSVELPRVYFFYMCISLSTKNQYGRSTSHTRMYQITMKKDGIGKVEKMTLGSLKKVPMTQA